MRYTKPRKVYSCAICGTACVTLHELIFGNGNRPIAVDNSIQAPLCTEHHRLAHTHKIEYQEKLFEWLGLDMYTAIRAFNNKTLRAYLYIHKAECEARIEELEI